MIFCLLLITVYSSAQQKALNIPGLHQLVSDSKSEYSLQNDARNKQALVSLHEHENKTLLAKLKTKYRELQQRYQTLGTIISAANIGINATPMVNHIVKDQSEIYLIAFRNPAYVALAYQTEIEFLTKAHSLFNYLVGLTASIGAVNQMKASDRKILFDYILTELNTIRSLSSKLLNAMQFSEANGLLRTLNPFQSYVDQDKRIVQDIINNAKYLKR